MAILRPDYRHLFGGGCPPLNRDTRHLTFRTSLLPLTNCEERAHERVGINQRSKYDSRETKGVKHCLQGLFGSDLV